LIDSLSATKRFYDKDAKCYVEAADNMARIAAANSICAQAIGLPVQRIVRQTMTFKDRQTELLELAWTPSGREMLLRAGIISPPGLKNMLPSWRRKVEVPLGIISMKNAPAFRSAALSQAPSTALG
jgi:hypothetical protein